MQNGGVVELVVTDLDGTLWNRDGEVPQSTRDAIRELERRGVPLLVATARRSWSAAFYLERAQLDLPALLLNGALGRDCQGGDIFHQRIFEPRGAMEVLDVFDRSGVNPCVNFESEKWDVVSGPSPSAGQVYLNWAGSQLKAVHDLRSMANSLPVYAFSVVACSEVDLLRKVSHELAGLDAVGMANLFQDRVFGGWTLDTSPTGVNKWSGVEAFCHHRGLDPTKVLAVGDGDKDVELLERSAQSCAISHATDRARAAAMVTLKNGIDGWAGLLEYL